MLSFKLRTRIGEHDLLLPVTGHIVFTTVAGQGWLAGPKPSLDAPQHLTSCRSLIKGAAIHKQANLARNREFLPASGLTWAIARWESALGGGTSTL